VGALVLLSFRPQVFQLSSFEIRVLTPTKKVCQYSHEKAWFILNLHPATVLACIVCHGECIE
jgi:hypothetical protein